MREEIGKWGGQSEREQQSLHSQGLMRRLSGRLTSCEQHGVGVRFQMSLVMLTRLA